MWISRKRFEALESRVRELSEATSMRGFCGTPMSWHYPKYDDKDISINKVVEKLAMHIGIQIVPAKGSQMVIEPPKRKP